jgi:hypothetical protein
MKNTSGFGKANANDHFSPEYIDHLLPELNP